MSQSSREAKERRLAKNLFKLKGLEWSDDASLRRQAWLSALLAIKEAELVDRETLEELAQLAKTAIDDGCKDPMVRFWYAHTQEKLGNSGWIEPLGQRFVAGFRAVEFDKGFQITAVGLDGIVSQGPLDSQPVEEILDELASLDSMSPSRTIRDGWRARADTAPGDV